MSDWTSGYVADIGYTFGYYGELNPVRIALPFANAGLVAPDVATACELGYGQGLSANFHAAGSNTNWFGTDFNPSQASFAQEIAKVSGAKANLFDDAFLDFAHRNDIPDFDFIGLHGIWSWISDENRSVIVDFIRRKLKVGGVLYISYNTLPGWAAFAPMRHLMTEHAEVIGAEGRGIVSRINDAIDFADKLLATNPLFSRANPLVAERIKKLKDQNRHYLAHEYFNRDWHPMHFSTMAQWLEPAKLQYACSAHLNDHIDAINLSAEQQTFLKEIPDEMFRQSVRDFMINQQFRRDYWVKGSRRLNAVEQASQLRAQRLMLVTPCADVPLKTNGALGEANLAEAVYAPVLDALANHQPKSIGELEKALAKSVSFPQLIQAMIVLTGAGHLQSVKPSSGKTDRAYTDRVNRHLMEKARSSGEISYLVSPETGGGLAVNRFQQLFLQSKQQGKKSPEDWAKDTWAVLKAQGQSIIKEGQPLKTDDENIKELHVQALVFQDKTLPVLSAAGIA